ncbi:MAG: CBS domain-containing protein [Nanopusillaceae archaeon]
MAVFVTNDKKIKDIVNYIAKGEDIVITNNKGKYIGLVSNEKALRYLNKPETNIEKIMIKIKPLKTKDIVEIIEKMINSNLRSIIVEEDGKIVVYSIFDILKTIINDKKILEKIKIEDFSGNVYTIDEKDTIDKAIGIMKHKGVSRLIVVNEKGEAIGILSLSDILRYLLIKDNEKLRTPELTDLEVEVRSIINRQLIFANKNDSIEKVIDLLIRNRIFSVPVLDNGKPVTIITAKDILIHYLQLKKEEEINITVFGIPLDEIDQKYIKNKYESFYRKYKNVIGEARLIIHVKKVNENIRERKIYYVMKARLISEKTKLYAEESGYEFYSTVNNLFNILENEIEKIKHKNEREYYLENIFKNDVIQYL